MSYGWDAGKTLADSGESPPPRITRCDDMNTSSTMNQTVSAKFRPTAGALLDDPNDYLHRRIVLMNFQGEKVACGTPNSVANVTPTTVTSPTPPSESRSPRSESRSRSIRRKIRNIRNEIGSEKSESRRHIEQLKGEAEAERRDSGDYVDRRMEEIKELKSKLHETSKFKRGRSKLVGKGNSGRKTL